MLTEKEIKDITEVTALLIKVEAPEVKSNVKGYLQGALDREELERQKQDKKKGA